VPHKSLAGGGTILEVHQWRHASQLASSVAWRRFGSSSLLDECFEISQWLQGEQGTAIKGSEAEGNFWGTADAAASGVVDLHCD
jgi:hypothetical protein